MTVKFSGVDGTELWRIPGSASAMDSAGDFIVGSSRPLTVTKISGKDGSEIWRVFIDAPIDGNGHTLRDLTIDDAGDVLIAGALQQPGNLSWDFAVIKFAGATGAELWRYEAKGSPDGTEIARALAIDPSGNIVAGGDLGSERGGDFFVVKLSGSAGSEIWRRGVPGTGLGYDEVFDVAVDASGSVVAAGRIWNADTAWDMAVLKLSGATGDELWRQEINGTSGSLSFDMARVVAFDAAGDVLVGGKVENAGRRAHSDFTVAKLSGASGTRLWYREIRGTSDTGNGEVHDLIEDAAGDVIAVGEIQNLGANWDFAVVKLSGDDGSDLWRRDLNGTAHSSDGALAVAVDASGDVIVAGHTKEACTSSDFVVVKLNGIDGSGDLGIRDQCLNLVSGRRLQLRDPPGRPWKRRLAFISRDVDFVTPTRGPASPTRDGGFLEILNPDTGQKAVYQLPAERWREIGERGDPRGWEYRDRWRQDGPCGKVIIRNKPRNRLKAICSGITFDFPLDEATQGGLAFRIVTGAEVTSTYCAAFGGRVAIDKPGRFFASGAPAPEGCPFP